MVVFVGACSPKVDITGHGPVNGINPSIFSMTPFTKYTKKYLVIRRQHMMAPPIITKLISPRHIHISLTTVEEFTT